MRLLAISTALLVGMCSTAIPQDRVPIVLMQKNTSNSGDCPLCRSAKVVRAVDVQSSSSSRKAIDVSVVRIETRSAVLVRGQPVRNVARVLAVRQPVRTMLRRIAARKPLRTAMRHLLCQ